MNQMLLDYVIIKLSESKTTKGVFTYYIIREGGRGIMGDGEGDYGRWGGGWPCDDIS